jgi:hypothetical protein
MKIKPKIIMRVPILFPNPDKAQKHPKWVEICPKTDQNILNHKQPKKLKKTFFVRISKASF